MSKAEILNNISRNKPVPAGLPVSRKINEAGNGDLLQEFIDKAKSSGSHTQSLDSPGKVDVWMAQQKKNGKSMIDLSQVPDEKDHPSLSTDDPINLDIVVIRGQLGVAENGAVWIDESDMLVRKLPFLTLHLVLVLEKANIVANMIEAYQKIDLKRSGFGVFIAGPSKTADIEQSLVIGAHGPIAHTILLY